MPNELAFEEPNTAQTSQVAARCIEENDSAETENSQDTSSSESESNDFDRNNNDKTPTVGQKCRQTEAHSSHAAKYVPSENLHRVHSSNSTLSTHSGYDSDDELVQQSVCDASPIMPGMPAEVKYADKITPLNAGDLEDDTNMIQCGRRLGRMQTSPNANENNNSNRKRSNKIYATSRARMYAPRKQNFHGKRRSVQLSSIRASTGIYQASAIKPFRERMICKDGTSNVRFKKFGKFDLVTRYSRDIYTTLIDLSWTWVILLTSLVYVGHWVIFGFMYWLFAYLHDDYVRIFTSAVDQAIENNSTSSFTTTSSAAEGLSNDDPCVSQVYDFASAFLFSLESETTIGYGYRAIGTTCPEAIICLIIQCVISAIFDTWVIGMCFSRLARPDARTKTMLYARNAVICTRDGKRCLIIRVANLRKSLLLTVSCRAHVITLRAPLSVEEEQRHQFMLEQKELAFENANATMLTAPVEYKHIIDEDSPLHTIPEKCFMSEEQNWFEIVMIVTGIVEATGMTMHAQTSYLSSEIKYKHRYVPVLSVSPMKDRYIVNFKMFDETIPEPQAVDLLAASRLRKQTNEERKSTMAGRCEVLMEESEDDDVFSENSPASLHRSICNCSHSYDDDNMNVVCSCGKPEKYCLNTDEDENLNRVSSIA